MRIIVGLFAAIFIGALSQAFATDPPAAQPPQMTSETASPVTGNAASASSAATAASPNSATKTAAAAPAATAPSALPKPLDSSTQAKPVVDDAVSDIQLKRLRAAGYKPEVHHGETVFCRSEKVLGSRFDQRVCNTAKALSAQATQAQDETTLMQKDYGKPRGN